MVLARIQFLMAHLVTKLPDLLADPDRVRSGFHGHSRWSKIAEVLIHSGRVASEPALVDDLAVFVERAVMAPDVPKVDPDCHPGMGTSAWF